MKRVILAAIFLSLAGCGGDSGPKNANISGSWTYTVTNLVGGGITCNTSGTTLQLNQSGTTFSGSYSGGTITCSAPGVAPETAPIGTGDIIDGAIGVSDVSFDLDTSDWSNTGTLVGNSMSGTAVVFVTDGTTSATLTGHFAAVRN
jgi:hypothetical protein